ALAVGAGAEGGAVAEEAEHALAVLLLLVALAPVLLSRALVVGHQALGRVAVGEAGDHHRPGHPRMGLDQLSLAGADPFARQPEEVGQLDRPPDVRAAADLLDGATGDAEV